MNQRYVLLDPKGLASKFGFQDGDLFFNDYYDWMTEAFGEAWKPYQHECLVALVCAFVIPRVLRAHHSVWINQISSSHNPIRLEGLGISEDGFGEWHPGKDLWRLEDLPPVRVPWDAARAVLVVTLADLIIKDL